MTGDNSVNGYANNATYHLALALDSRFNDWFSFNELAVDEIREMIENNLSKEEIIAEITKSMKEYVEENIKGLCNAIDRFPIARELCDITWLDEIEQIDYQTLVTDLVESA